MDRDRPAFGMLLRRYRLSAGLTQEALAERAGLSLRGLSDLERGVRRAPYADTVDRLVDALDLGPNDRAMLQSARHRRNGARLPPIAADWRRARSDPADAQAEAEREPITQAGLPFVGRHAELGALNGILQAAANGGHGCLVLVSGEPGIGKSRLVLEVAERAQARDWKVLCGRATAVEGAPAYLPIIEALRGYIDACSVPTLRAPTR
jgi:transcriptional regulator with XRE-family HTH domain